MQVAQLQGRRLPAQFLGGQGEVLGSLLLSMGMDDLGPLLALGLGLLGHRALHLWREIDVLDLHGGDLDSL